MFGSPDTSAQLVHICVGHTEPAKAAELVVVPFNNYFVLQVVVVVVVLNFVLLQHGY